MKRAPPRGSPKRLPPASHVRKQGSGLNSEGKPKLKGRVEKKERRKRQHEQVRKELQSKVYQGLKAINKAMKTAKLFEARKAARRAKEAEGKGAAQAAHHASLRDAAKRVDAHALAIAVVDEMRLPPFALDDAARRRFLAACGAKPSDAGARDPADLIMAAAERRVTSVRAVRDAAERLRAEVTPLLARIGITLPRAGPPGPGPGLNAVAGDDNKGENGVGDEGSEGERGVGRSGRGTAASDDGDDSEDGGSSPSESELDDETLALIDKLRGARGGRDAAGPDGEGESGSVGESEDSGVMEWNGEGASDMSDGWGREEDCVASSGSGGSDGDDGVVVKRASDALGLLGRLRERVLERQGRTAELQQWRAEERRRQMRGGKERGQREGRKGGAGRDDGVDGGVKKKNRLGQRARRKLLEAQYGSDANHVKRGSGSDKARDEAGSRGEGAVGSGAVLKHATARKEGAGTERSQGAQDGAAVHPSWAAKRRASVAGVAIQPRGVKVTFGEDGAVASKAVLDGVSGEGRDRTGSGGEGTSGRGGAGRGREIGGVGKAGGGREEQRGSEAAGMDGSQAKRGLGLDGKRGVDGGGGDRKSVKGDNADKRNERKGARGGGGGVAGDRERKGAKGTSGATPSYGDVHPSWAARQASKAASAPAILSPAGKKIVFD